MNIHAPELTSTPARPFVAGQTWLALVLVCLLLVGCRQPVTQPGQGPFSGGGLSGIFGGNSRVAQTPAATSPWAANTGNYAGFNNNFSGNNPYGVGVGPATVNPNPAASGIPQQQYAQMANQFQTMNQRLAAYDTDNQLLNTELASLKQRLELSNQYSQQLKQQLADTSSRIQQSEQEKQVALQRLAAAQGQLEQLQQAAASTPTSGRLASYPSGGNSLGGATITANNSLIRRINEIQIPGGQARVDGDVIRIEFPSDKLFDLQSQRYEIQPAQLPVLQQIAATLRQSFPKQIIGVEAHWDNTPLTSPTISHHQYTATQALAVFERLVSLGVPREQMFTMALGSNRPRHAQQVANGIHPNRRIELVIYPETYDGS